MVKTSFSSPRTRTNQRRSPDSASRSTAATAGLSVSCRASHASRRRSEEHTSELQSLMRISYAVFCLKKKMNKTTKEATEKTYERTSLISISDTCLNHHKEKSISRS